MISIIIPTFNEERCIARILDCLKKQTYKNYEIIVADADSKDNTVKIAKRRGCKVVRGGMPAVGRNNGAKRAKGELLLFLDADSAIGDDFLENSVREIEKNRLDIAGSYLYSASGNIIDNLFLSAFNFWIWSTQSFYPNACGTGIFCRKILHENIKGFDETIRLSEDMDYVRRAGKFGKFRIIRKSKVVYSMRRYKKEGSLKVGLKLFLSAIYRIIFGEIRTDIFKYNLRYSKLR